MPTYTIDQPNFLVAGLESSYTMFLPNKILSQDLPTEQTCKRKVNKVIFNLKNYATRKCVPGCAPDDHVVVQNECLENF